MGLERICGALCSVSFLLIEPDETIFFIRLYKAHTTVVYVYSEISIDLTFRNEWQKNNRVIFMRQS